MLKIHPYLNFDGNTEEAFNFYKSVFGGEFSSVMRFGEMPGAEADKMGEDGNRIMHISLPIGEGAMLMASDIMPSMGQTLNEGNNVYVSLHPDNVDEAKRLFEGLSAGGKVEMALEKMFWGAYYGAFQDKFGINWMVNCEVKE